VTAPVKLPLTDCHQKDLVKLKTLKKSSAEAAYILGKLNGMIFLDPTQG